MNKTHTLLIVSSFQVFLILFACTSTPTQQSGQSRVYVESLQENWPRLEASALEWHSDAYLIEVSLPIFVDSPKSQERLISAFFSSLSDTREMLEPVCKI